MKTRAHLRGNGVLSGLGYLAIVALLVLAALQVYRPVRDHIRLNRELSAAQTRLDDLKILHPLPRVNEITYDVDDNPKAYYFQQAQNGLYARQAILCDVLGITLNDVIEDAKK